MVAMFTIRLFLNNLAEEMSGLKALDWLRAHGLPDGTLVQMWTGVGEVRLDVNEAFARRYFPPDSRSVSMTVDPDQTAPGDLKIDENDGKLYWSDNVSDQRIMDLWIGAYIHSKIEKAEERANQAARAQQDVMLQMRGILARMVEDDKDGKINLSGVSDYIEAIESVLDHSWKVCP